MATSKRLYRLENFIDNVAIAFSPDSKLLASAEKFEVTLWDVATGKRLHRLDSFIDNVAIAFSPDSKLLASVAEDKVTLWDAVIGERLHFPFDRKQLSSIPTNLTTSSTTAASTLTKMTPSGTNKLPYSLDETKDGKIDFIHDSGKPMAQIRNALSYIEGGPHTVNIYVDWQLPEFVRDCLDKLQDLATVLTITGEPDKAYVCSCEDYMKLAWSKNTSIPEFFRAFTTSELISSAKARKYHLSQLNRH